MSHITQEQAMKIADASGVLGCEFSEFEQKMCDFANTAIQHYIDSAALAQPEPIKDHEIAKLVGDIAAVAREFHDQQSLRERISQLVRPWAKPEPVEPQPRLKVRLTAFPESNGKQNWTALLMREQKWGGLVGNCGGITIAHGELWNRVAYEAERAKFLIGERNTEPFILDYGDDIKTPAEWKGEIDGPLRAAAKGGV